MKKTKGSGSNALFWMTILSPLNQPVSLLMKLGARPHAALLIKQVEGMVLEAKTENPVVIL